MKSEKITRLLNGVQVVTINMPHVDSVSVGVFVRTGSRNETSKLNGISHFLEHMAFKGTSTRTCREIATSVERLGAYMNAYTSKDTTCYHMSGLAKHTSVFVEMLADMVQNNIFPEEELERERNVILQEINQYEDDATSIAYTLFDVASFGSQPMGRSILGPKKNIKSFTRDDFVKYVKDQYTAENLIVGVSGNVDHEAAIKMVERAFSSVPSGSVNQVSTPTYYGGVKTKRKSAFTQSTVLMGFPIASLREDFYADILASGAIGDGMSSPLFSEIREKRGLAYAVGSYDYVADNVGQFYISAGTTVEHLDEFFSATCDLLKTVATKVDPIDLERAVNQICVTKVRNNERPFSRMSDAVEDLFTYGALTDTAEFTDRLNSVTTSQVQDSISKMIQQPPTVVMVGKGASDAYLDVVVSRLK